jgi:hypothetical protein
MANRELNALRWVIEQDAAFAQSLHDAAMGVEPGAAITDAERVAYVCKTFGVDLQRLDASIQADRAMRCGAREAA